MHLQLLEGSGQKGSDNNRNICDAVAHHQDMKHDVMDAFRTLEWGRQGATCGLVSLLPKHADAVVMPRPRTALHQGQLVLQVDRQHELE
jgi:hypothetical protein